MLGFYLYFRYQIILFLEAMRVLVAVTPHQCPSFLVFSIREFIFYLIIEILLTRKPMKVSVDWLYKRYRWKRKFILGFKLHCLGLLSHMHGRHISITCDRLHTKLSTIIELYGKFKSFTNNTDNHTNSSQYTFPWKYFLHKSFLRRLPVHKLFYTYITRIRWIKE